jgi:hypothetical protein
MRIPEIKDAPTTSAAEATDQRGKARSSRGRRFGEILRAAGSIAIAALPAVGPILSRSLPSLTRNGLDPRTLGVDGSSEALQYLELQRAISREARHYETLSNVMKARHEAAMNTIRNLRS